MKTTPDITPLFTFAAACGINPRPAIPQIFPICLGSMRNAREWSFHVLIEEGDFEQVLRVKAGIDYQLSDVVAHLMDDPDVYGITGVKNTKAKTWHALTVEG